MTSAEDGDVSEELSAASVVGVMDSRWSIAENERGNTRRSADERDASYFRGLGERANAMCQLMRWRLDRFMVRRDSCLSNAVGRFVIKTFR